MRLPLPRNPHLLVAIITLALLAAIIALSVEFSKSKMDHGTAPISNPAPVVEVSQPSDDPPVVDSPLGATDVIFGTYFGVASNKPQSKVVYNSGGGKICVHTKLEGTWLDNVHCVDNANPKYNTPITILDWAGGPSIYYITADNKLSGIDNVPANDTWVLSSLAMQNVAVHPQSRIASVTWLNGSSAWVYYQDNNSQLRELGLDDFRDKVWRDGSNGPLGLAANGSFFAATRYSIGADEFEEVYFEADSNIIHGRRYAYGVWGNDLYAVDGTTSGFAAGAAFSVTTIVNSSTNTNTVLVAYMTTDGFVTTQTRGTANITDFGAFSKAVHVTQNDGNASAGLVVDGSSGTSKLYTTDKQKILEFASDGTAMNWTAATDITT